LCATLYAAMISGFPTAATLPASPRAWTAGSLAVLLVLLALHAALIAWVVAGLFPESPYNTPDATGLRQIAGPAAVLLVALAFADRRRPAFAVALAVFATTLALLLPGPILTAAWVLFDAWLLGRALLGALARGHDDPPLDPAVSTLVGVALVIGVLAVCARWSVHYPGVYAVALCVPLATLLSPRNRIVLRLPSSAAWAAAERVCLALLGTVVVVHVFVVAKPEVGFDAQTMHLQFAHLVAARHAWTFDVQRYGWAVMPLGADWMFALGYMLSGETGARVLNLSFGLLAGWLLFTLTRAWAPRLPALVTVTLFASAPLAFLVTGSLFSETLWCAFLLATLICALGWYRTRAPAHAAALFLTAAGALQCKAISLLWLGPLGLGLLFVARGSVLKLDSWRLRGAVALAVAIGVWPYANAAWRTGNPLFPFFNNVFRSPLVGSDSSFSNAAYHSTLWPWSPWLLVTDSGRFLEGAPGAPGFHWLLLLPLALFVMARFRLARAQWACIALGAAFFVAVFVQQAYLRYLLPALLVGAAAGGWALAALPDRRLTRIVLGAASVVLIALNLRFMYTGSWYHANLCERCAFDAQARREYVVRYASLRIVAAWLNEHVPDARVGLFTLNDATPAGYVGASRGGNWHDLAVFPALTGARGADDVLAIARKWDLTHVVVHVTGSPEEAAITAFRDRDTRPIWQFENYRVAVVAPASADRPPLAERR